MTLYALYRISLTDTFILISSHFSSTRRCKESHFSTVHDWDLKSTRALQAHLKAAFHLQSHLLEYKHTEALSNYTEHTGKIAIARKTGLEHNSCRTLWLVPCHQLLGRALQCIKWGCFLITMANPLFEHISAFTQRKYPCVQRKDLQMLKTFESKCIRWFNYYTQVWCKYLSVCVLQSSKYAAMPVCNSYSNTGLGPAVLHTYVNKDLVWFDGPSVWKTSYDTALRAWTQNRTSSFQR